MIVPAFKIIQFETIPLKIPSVAFAFALSNDKNWVNLMKWFKGTNSRHTIFIVRLGQ